MRHKCGFQDGADLFVAVKVAFISNQIKLAVIRNAITVCDCRLDAFRG